MDNYIRNLLFLIAMLLQTASQVSSDCCGSYSRRDCIDKNGKPLQYVGYFCGDCATPSGGFGCCGAEGSAGGGHYGCNLFCCNCKCRPWCSDCSLLTPPVSASGTLKSGKRTKMKNNNEAPTIKDKVDSIIAKFDKNKDGKIDFSEFSTAMVGTRSGVHTVENMYAAYQFDTVDQNKDGSLDPNEIDKDYEK